MTVIDFPRFVSAAPFAVADHKEMTMTPEAAARISVREFNFYYGRARALHGITMDIPDRQVTALIGPSGCGKSTFVRSMNRMNDIIPEARGEGTIEIDGSNIYGNGIDVVALRRR